MGFNREGMKVFVDGVEVKRSDKLELPDEYKSMEVPEDKGSFSISITCPFEPNWLWKIKQKTGHPNNVEVSWW